MVFEKILARLTLAPTVLIICAAAVSAQNIGINTTTPSQPLEVGGVIFTNEGGVMFPDSSVQTTAAAATNPTEAADTGRLYAVMDITSSGISGPFMEPGYEGTFRVFDLKIDLIHPSMSAFKLNSFEVLTDIGQGIVPLFENLATTTAMPEIKIHLLDSALQTYFSFILENVYLKQMVPQVVYTGHGEYAHVYRLDLDMEALHLEDVPNAQFFGWNFVTNTAD